MGKVVDMGQGKLQITYGGLESPIAGIDASKFSDIYLNPQSLAAASGMFAQDGYLSSAFINAITLLNLSNTTNNSPYVIGDVQVNAITQTPPYRVTKASYGFIAVSEPTQLVVYEYTSGFQGQNPTNTISISANQSSTLTYYVVNGVVYITGLGFGAIYAYTPVSGNASTLTQLTNYVGGAYLGELNGRLLCLCCDAITAGVYSYSPFQVSWSGASGAYSVWNPLVGGLVTGAGYNNLPDVADEITGFFAIGPTGYIIRKQGITEMTPLNSGIQPFDFNHMWASNKGVGSVYPNTITQYGSLGAFLSDTGMYTLGYGGINTIHGNFWSFIVQQLQYYLGYTPGGPNYNDTLQTITGGLVPITIAASTNLNYILYIPNTDVTGSFLLVGNVLTQDWNVIPCFTNEQAGINLVKIAAISNAALFNFGSSSAIALVSAVIGTQLILFTVNDTLNLPNTYQPAFGFSFPFCAFPIEEVGMFKDITVNSIGIYADGDVSSTDLILVTPTVSNLASNAGPNATVTPVSYSTVTLSALNSFAMSYPASGSGPCFCGKYPQLELQTEFATTANAALRIYKIVLFCSYDPRQIP